MELGVVGVDRLRRVRSKSKAQQVCVQGAAGIAAMVDGPFELDAVQPRRPMLETDHGHVDLGIIAVAQSRRRVVRLRWGGHLGWSTRDAKLLLTTTGIGNPSADGICGPDEVWCLVRRYRPTRSERTAPSRS